MAHIEHIALWTQDIERLVKFYSGYFGATVGPAYTNPAKGFESRFLRFDDGARIELMKTTGLSPTVMDPGEQRMGLTHLAITIGSEERVEALSERLRTDGYAITDGPRRTGDGYYESVVLDPDGNRIEITA